MSKPVKVFVGICGILCSLLLLFVIFLPKIVSSNKGKDYILDTINLSINGRISAEKIGVQWFGGQLAERVTIHDQSGETVATLELVSTSQSLWDILFNGLSVNHSQLVDLNANIVRYSNGMTNIQQALSRSPQRDFDKTIDTTILAKHVNALVHVSEDKKNIRSQIEGKTQQGELEGEFSLELNMLLDDLQALKGVDDLELILDVKNFPVAFIDSIASINNHQLSGLTTSLLGKSLNATITEKQNGNVASTHWVVTSPNLEFKLNGNLDTEGFSLAEPAKAELRLTKDFIESLTEKRLVNAPLSLTDTANLNLVINTLSFPFDFKSEKNIGVDLEFNVSEVEITGGTLSKNLVLEQIKGKIQAPVNTEEATLQFIGKARDRGEDSFEMKVDATIEKPKDFNHFMESLKEKASFNIEARGIPSMLFDGFVSDTIQLHDLVGDHVHLKMDGQSQSGEGFFSVSLRSDNIQLQNANFSFNNGIELQEPIKFAFILTPQAFNELFPGELSLRHPAHFQLVFDQLSIPISATAQTAPLKVQSEIIAMSEVQFDNLNKGSFSLENSSIEVEGSSLDSIQVVLNTGVTTHEDSGLSWELMGASTQVKLSAKFATSSSEKLQLSEAQAHVEGSTIQLDVNSEVQNGKLSLTAPATIDYVMSPSMIQSLFPRLEGVKNISDDVPVHLTIATQKPSVLFSNYKELDLSGHISVPLIPLKFGEEKISLRDIMIPWEFNGSQKKAKLSLSGASYLPGKEKKGTFKGKLSLRDWYDDALYKLRLDLINFPTETFNVIDDTHAMPTLFGDTLQAEIDADFHGNGGENGVDILVEGEGFLFRAALAFGRVISLKDPSDPVTIKIDLTPDRFNLISKTLRPNPKYPLALVGDSGLELSLDHLNIPITKQDYSIPLWNAGIKGKVHFDKMLLFDKKRNRKLPLDEINAHVNTENLASSMTFELSTESDVSGKEDAKLAIKGTVEKAFKTTGELNLEELSLNADVLAKDLQTEAFCQLFCPYPTMADKVQALIGDPINADFDVHIRKLDGPVKGTLKGTNGHASLNAYAKSGYLFLKQPFIAQVKATPHLGQAILREIAPFLSGLKESSEPITLRIDPQGFSFPIKDFEREKISVGLCSLNMGRMVFQNSGQMQAVLGLLGSSAAEMVPVWVTPLYVRMDQGKIKLERVDMLLNNRFPIASWGEVDIVKEKVNMTIGITGYALATALNIKNIQPDYMLQIPLKGPLNQPKLDKKKAAAKISALVAQDHGTQGLVIGTVLDIATGGLNESTPPSPTTQPLPWAGQLPKLQETSAPPESEEKTLIDTSKEKVQKGAKKLIKKIFN